MANFSKTLPILREEIASSSTDARLFLKKLFDEGTFLKSGDGAFEGVITGCGSVLGRPVYAFVQDSDNISGAFTTSHGKKIINLYKSALKAGAPVIGVFSGAGAKVEEGISCLSAYGSLMANVSEAKGVIPQIAVVNGVCGGAAAILSEMFDFTVCTDDAERYVIPNGRKYTACNIKVSKDELESTLRTLVSLIPSSCDNEIVCGEENENINEGIYGIDALVSEDSDAHELISALSDDAAPFFLSDSENNELITALMTFNGRVIGAVASQPSVNGGALTSGAAKKASSFINFCGCFNIPVLTLVNTVGFMGEKCDYLSSLSDLAIAYSSCPSPAVTAIVGKAYGSAFTLLGSKALGADVVFALDSSEISVMKPESAVEFLCENEIKEATDPVEARKILKEEWINTSASPLSAARNGDIDDIIASSELKQRIASSLEFLLLGGAL